MARQPKRMPSLGHHVWTWRFEDKFQYEILVDNNSWRTVHVLRPDRVEVDITLTVQRSKSTPPHVRYVRVLETWFPVKDDGWKHDHHHPCHQKLDQTLQAISEDWSRRLLETIL